jgi:hypothetical protein
MLEQMRAQTKTETETGLMNPLNTKPLATS